MCECVFGNDFGNAGSGNEAFEDSADALQECVLGKRCGSSKVFRGGNQKEKLKERCREGLRGGLET